MTTKKNFLFGLLFFIPAIMLHIFLHTSHEATQIFSIYSEISTTPSDSNVALCIAGYRIEALLIDSVYESIMKYVISSNAVDLFVYGETNRLITVNGDWGDNTTFEINEFKSKYHKVLRSFVISSEKLPEINLLQNHNPLSNLSDDSRKERLEYILPLHLKYMKCSHMLLEPYSLHFHKNYSAVARMRPDLQFYSELNWKILDSKAVHFPGIESNSYVTFPWERVDPPIYGLPDQICLGSSQVMSILAGGIYALIGTSPSLLEKEDFVPEALMLFIVKTVFHFDWVGQPATKLGMYRNCKILQGCLPHFGENEHTSWYN